MPQRLRPLFTLAFWLDAGERALKSFGQGSATALVQAHAVGLFDASWQNVLGAGGLMAAASLLTSIASAPVAGASPASLAPA